MPHSNISTPVLTATQAAQWLAKHVTRILHTDSRNIKPGDGFIALLGHNTDGRNHVSAALTAGASACLVEADDVERFNFGDARIAGVAGLKQNLGAIAHEFYGEPSAALKVIASTGTNGKTSTAWWMAQALSRLNQRCGIIGTLGVGEPGSTVSTGLTTPDAATMHHTLRSFIDGGYTACALEASSIGIVEHRLDAVEIDVALFTNFTQDHLDYHGSMEAYWQAKRALFSWPSLKAAVINIDDAHGAKLAPALELTSLDVWTVSISQAARLRAQNIAYKPDGVAFEVLEGNEIATVQSALIGEYNVSNLLVALGGLRALGHPLQAAATVACKLSPVPGRLEPVSLSTSLGAESLPTVIVDYAHTPDALEKVLLALRPVAQARGGRLWCVFGCGGNRDASKRPRMGSIAAQLADNTIITSDNPRLEDPTIILAQVAEGAKLEKPTLQHILVIEDRNSAIAHAIAHANAHDIILLAGKGHEDYQDSGGVKRPYSDFSAAAAALNSRLAKPLKSGFFSDIADKKILILGLGESGLAMAQWCAAKGARVAVWDSRASPPHAQTLADTVPAAIRLQGILEIQALDGVDLVLKSPGLSPLDTRIAALLAEAQLRQIGIGNELTIFIAALTELRDAQNYAPKIIAITGTNGKTTTTSLTAQLVESSGKTVAMAGNIGPTLLGTLMERRNCLPEVWVLELSSFQLDGVENFNPTAATILNITQDHLDWHGNMAAYIAAKSRVFGADTIAIVNRDEHFLTQFPTQQITFGLDAPTKAGDFGLSIPREDAGAPNLSCRDAQGNIAILIPANALRIRGRHNAANALAAVALAQSIGCPMPQMLAALREYAGEPHRVQLIRTINGVEFYDDSKGTNVGATVAALDGLGSDKAPNKLVLILGGDGKGQDFSPLTAPLRRHARAIATIGRDAAGIEAIISEIPTLRHATLEAAVKWCFAHAQPGDAVLLSPACASLDMFRNYSHRAEVFVQAAQELANDCGTI